MKKTSYTIRLKDDESKEVSGYISDYFGIHKMVDGGYSVTHLLTGLRITSYLKMGQARKFIQLLEESEADWMCAEKETLMEHVAIMAICNDKVLGVTL